jgi:hypothetical protein
MDQTIRAQSRRITGTQLRFAVGAVWHLNRRLAEIAAAILMLFALGAVTCSPAIPYLWQVSRVEPARQIDQRRKGDS